MEQGGGARGVMSPCVARNKKEGENKRAWNRHKRGQDETSTQTVE